jgi:hypothetical protein
MTTEKNPLRSRKSHSRKDKDGVMREFQHLLQADLESH